MGSASHRGLTLGGLLMLLALIGVAFLVFWWYRSSRVPTEAPRGHSLFAFHFSEKDINGNVFSTRGRQGRVVLVNIFATWCGPCRLETPHLMRLYEAKKDQHLDIVMVSKESPGPVRDFSEQFKTPFPMIADGAAILDQVPGFTRSPEWPTTLLIDKEGNLRYRIPGAELLRIHDAVNALLAE